MLKDENAPPPKTFVMDPRECQWSYLDIAFNELMKGSNHITISICLIPRQTCKYTHKYVQFISSCETFFFKLEDGNDR